MPDASPYGNDKCGLRLRDSFCLYADILGFAGRTKEASDAGQSEQLFRQLSQIVERTKEVFNPPGAPIPDELMWSCRFFSDCFVLGCPSFFDVVGFERLLDCIAEWQLHLACNGFFLRGGLAVGDLHIGEDVIYGPALVEAYEVEKSKPGFSRIVLSKSMRNAHQKMIEQDNEDGVELPRHERLVKLDVRTGQYFIDYLHTALAPRQSVDYDAICSHRQQIVVGLEKHKNRPKIRRKYEWLAKYHDAFCEGNSQGQRERLMGLRVNLETE